MFEKSNPNLKIEKKKKIVDLENRDTHRLVTVLHSSPTRMSFHVKLIEISNCLYDGQFNV